MKICYLSTINALASDDIELFKTIIKPIKDINQVFHSYFPRESLKHNRFRDHLLIDIAIVFQSTKCVKYLISKGAEINRNIDYDPVIFLAARKVAGSGKFEILEALAKAKANFAVKDPYGRTIFQNIEELQRNPLTMKIETEVFPYYFKVLDFIKKHI